MATSYTSLLGLALPVTGELAGTWGDTVNNYITSYIDASVAGTQTLSTDADATLTKTTGTSLGSTSSQYAILNCTGARTALRTITVPAASKDYLVINGTTGGYGVKIVGAGPTTGVTIANGKAALIAWNGSDFVTVASNDASVITGILAVANGGTGKSSWTANGVVYASGTTTLANGSAVTYDGTTFAITGAANFATSSGSVGIGTASPNVKLEVSGSGDTAARVSTTGTANSAVLQLYNGSGTTSNLYSYVRLVNNDTNAQDWRIGTYGTNNFSIVNAKASTTPVTIDTSGNVGVGLSTVPDAFALYNASAARLGVYGDGQTQVNATRFSTDTSGPAVGLRKARGTYASPTAVASGDTISTVNFTAYGGSNYRTVAQIAGYVDTYTSDTNISSYITFGTSPSGSAAVTEQFRITSTGGITSANLADAVGYKGTPLNEQSTAYTLVIGDMGKSIVHPASDNNARTFTIPANSSVAFPVGTTITFINMVNTVTIAITTDTMYLAGAGTTGSRTLAAYGMATAVKMTSTTWIISGNGLT